MIHHYQLNGYNIVIDTYSGSVHVVDDLAYEIIALYEHAAPEQILMRMKEKHYSEESIRETISEVEELISNGQLFTEDAYEELSIDLQNENVCEGALSQCRAYLQSVMRILLRQPRKVQWRSSNYELRSWTKSYRLFAGAFGPSPQP